MDENKVLVVKLGNDRKPHFEFKGNWVGKEVKFVLAKLPKAYRNFRAAILKEALKGESDDNRGKQEERERRETTTVQRKGRKPKRSKKSTGKNSEVRRRKQADTGGKTRIQDQSFPVPKDAGGKETAEGSQNSEHATA